MAILRTAATEGATEPTHFLMKGVKPKPGQTFAWLKRHGAAEGPAIPFLFSGSTCCVCTSYFWLTIQNITNRHVSSAFDLLAVFISFPLACFPGVFTHKKKWEF